MSADQADTLIRIAQGTQVSVTLISYVVCAVAGLILGKTVAGWSKR